MNRIVTFACALAALTHGAAGSDFEPLFDGTTLGAFTTRGGDATYRVESGAIIVGRTAPHPSPNTFLCTKAEYRDFELVYEVKLDSQLNSGVQIRSKSFAEYRDGRVHGPQVEIATDGSAGFIYGEAMDTGWLEGPTEEDRAANPFKDGEWNAYRVIAEGSSITTFINGVKVAHYASDDHVPDRGFIGLQVHSIRESSGPFEVKWRNLKIRHLGSE